jgi:hypothetical protein
MSTHLRSLNVNHYGIVETTRLRIAFNVTTSIQNLTQIHQSVETGHFGTAEATGFKSMASRSSSMASTAYQIS